MWRAGHGGWRRSDLRSPQHRTLRVLRQRNRDEITFWVEIIFAGFIDHSNLIMLGCFRVGDDTIELSQFQRGWIIPVSDADYELWFRAFHFRPDLNIAPILKSIAANDSPTQNNAVVRRFQGLPFSAEVFSTSFT
jgi:hypothetical protein